MRRGTWLFRAKRPQRRRGSISACAYSDSMPPAYRAIFAEWSPPFVLTGTLIVFGAGLCAGMVCYSQDAAGSISCVAAGMLSAWARDDLGCDCFAARWICRCSAERAYGGASSADVLRCRRFFCWVIRWCRCCVAFLAWVTVQLLGPLIRIEGASAIWALANHAAGGMAGDEPGLSWLACAGRL